MRRPLVQFHTTDEKLTVEIMGNPIGRLENGGPETLLSFEPLVGQKLDVKFGVLEVQNLPGIAVDAMVSFTPSSGKMQEFQVPQGTHELIVNNGEAELCRR